MRDQEELEHVRTSLKTAEHVQKELDRRVFHLKTLYDVSKDIFTSVDSERILRNFLLMTMGNFGVLEGFVLTADLGSKEISFFIHVGLDNSDLHSLKQGAMDFLLPGDAHPSGREPSVCIHPDFLPGEIACALPFTLEGNSAGLLGLGAKVVGGPFSQHDQELLVTLANNLVVALKNARSFEEIERLNKYLQTQNVQLESAYNRLTAAMRKVELLESIKACLSKFVPATVCRLIEKSPTSSMVESNEQDCSVLFVDIEGYTRLSERLGTMELGAIVEKYFSVFMDAIYSNEGDINETAGDGLMVIFLNRDKLTNALQAVETALSIRDKAASVHPECDALFEPLLFNIGINSGTALVGAAKFESYTGSRWTYTARGLTTNIAARIAGMAKGGAILLSETTATRVKDRFKLTSVGKHSLKNVSEDIELFSI